MTRILVFLLTLALLAFTACAPGEQSAQSTKLAALPASPPVITAATSMPTASPTVVPLTPDLSRILSDPLASSDPAQVDQSMRELTDWVREESGLRAALGPEADEILRRADQAQTAILQDILRQLQTAGKPKGMPAPLPPRSGELVAYRQFVSYINLLGVLGSATYKLYPPRDSNPSLSEKEYDTKVGENGRAHVKLQSTVAGPRMEAIAEMTIQVEQDGVLLEEKSKGRLSFNVCPDAQGLVPLDLSFQISSSAGGSGYSIQFTAHATGHVDDEGELASIDQDITSELSLQKGTSALGTVADDAFVQVNMQFTTGGLNSQGTNDPPATRTSASVLKASANATQELVDKAGKLGGALAAVQVVIALQQAQSMWQNNYCVVVEVPQGTDGRVMKGSETPFTATVRHNFEGVELPLPVMASLKQGGASVTPSGLKVPAPAAFVYKASDTAGETTVLELVSRSRRGTGRQRLRFLTEEEFYFVDQIVGLPGSRLTGTICALDQPFTLDIKGANAAGGNYAGSFKFAPSSPSGGRWTHTATTTCLPVKGCGMLSGSGTYQVEDDPDGKTKILMSQATMATSFGTATLQMAFDFDVVPSMGTCTPD